MKKQSFLLCFGALLLTCGVMAQSGDVASVVSGNNRFALDLYQQFSAGADQKGKNLFFSPISLSTALAMTYAGARTETETQMAKVLHFDVTQVKLPPAFASLMEGMQGRKGYQLAMANALWPQKDYPFLKEFMNIGTQYYQAGLQPLDYVGSAESARGTINRWVEQKTQDKIKELIKPNVLNALTRLVLTNAIYFKGNWETQFDPARTRSLPFWISTSESVQVPMMYLKKTAPYFREGNTFQVLELPYVGKDLSMVIVLPSREIALEKVEALLTPETLNRWISSMEPEEVDVYLPKFKISCSYSLGPVLGGMGMPDAFDEKKADFSGMTGNKALYIAHVIHKAFVEVNEEGTEAAAATAVVVATKSALLPAQFRANSPFIFLIRDKKSGSLLFLGRMKNPLITGE